MRRAGRSDALEGTRAGLVVLTLLLAPGARAQDAGWEYRRLDVGDGDVLEYAVALPDGYAADRWYPVLLALPPGNQTRAMVEAGLRRYWGRQATAKGWVVVSPVAPEGALFFRGGERHLRPLLRRIRLDFRIEGGRLHLAGASNGGLAAFRLAGLHPLEFRSLTVLPGHPPAQEDLARLPRLRDVVVRLFAGGGDARWVSRARDAEERLTKLGIDARLRVFPDEGHVPPSLDGGAVVDLLEELRQRARPEPGRAAAVSRALDDFHDAAAKADEERYFGLFAEEGVFLGTDGSERWTAAELEAWARPYFQRASAWIFVPQSRNVTAPDGLPVAWFDEVLGSAHYGECRGTGVLRLVDGRWRVAQYNLTVPVPNELLPRVVEMIREAGPR